MRYAVSGMRHAPGGRRTGTALPATHCPQPTEHSALRPPPSALRLPLTALRLPPTLHSPLSTLHFLLLLAALPILLAGCAGYQVGNQSLYPAHIRTVYVPVFESNSFRRNLGERLTEAVTKQIETKSPLKVVGDPNADSVLTGKIIGETKHVVVPSLTGDPREVQVSMVVQVAWTDRQGRMLREVGTIPLPPEVADVTGTANLLAEVGQSTATAQQQAINRVAQQIVGLMESPW